MKAILTSLLLVLCTGVLFSQNNIENTPVKAYSLKDSLFIEILSIREVKHCANENFSITDTKATFADGTTVSKFIGQIATELKGDELCNLWIGYTINCNGEIGNFYFTGVNETCAVYIKKLCAKLKTLDKCVPATVNGKAVDTRIEPAPIRAMLKN
ncbi:MAG: hypothetical protein BGO32_08720 [Bacteroidetes bacterium 37-13]|nr:MAG: hypothetical protein BGO32_08720 [Bacteroidetes bacterium 37-13]